VALEAQANKLVAAVLALKVAGNTHDHLWGAVMVPAPFRSGGPCDRPLGA
jgi:hypothetical protein